MDAGAAAAALACASDAAPIAAHCRKNSLLPFIFPPKWLFSTQLLKGQSIEPGVAGEVRS
jgi:hypothetical protein